jgi:hypothetical protein
MGRVKRRSASRKQRSGSGGVDRWVVKDDSRALDEEVEGEEEESQDEEEGAKGETAVGEAADGMEKAGGDYAEARFGARKIKRTDGFVAGQVAAEGGEFVFHPDREFFAVTPQIEGAEKKNPVAEASQQTKSVTGTPIKHGTSPPAGRPEHSKPLREW